MIEREARSPRHKTCRSDVPPFGAPKTITVTPASNSSTTCSRPAVSASDSSRNLRCAISSRVDACWRGSLTKSRTCHALDSSARSSTRRTNRKTTLGWFVRSLRMPRRLRTVARLERSSGHRHCSCRWRPAARMPASHLRPFWEWTLHGLAPRNPRGAKMSAVYPDMKWHFSVDILLEAKARDPVRSAGAAPRR